MKVELLERLRCPQTGQRLKLESSITNVNEIESGWLISEDSKHRYVIRNSIPRFVPEENYASNFGMQWNHFRQTQLDSYSGHTISADRFWNATGWKEVNLSGKWLLDVGCGAGRFAEVALSAGANVVALDYSSAVDASYENLKHHPNLHVVQGDIYALPFKCESFPFVYSLGVLQHTPDVAGAFAALPHMVSAEGRLCADFYWKRFPTMLHMKYLLRPITKHVPKQKLFNWLEKCVPTLLKTSQVLGRIPFAGKALKRLIPVADYTGIFGLTDQQLKEWALLDTFDMLAPEYDNPQTAAGIKAWAEAAGLCEIEVLHASHLVVRGRKVS